MLKQIDWKKCEKLTPGNRAHRVLTRLSRNKWIPWKEACRIVRRVTPHPAAMSYALSGIHLEGYVNGDPVLDFMMNGIGRDRFIEFAKKHEHDQVAIFIQLLKIYEKEKRHENNL